MEPKLHCVEQEVRYLTISESIDHLVSWTTLFTVLYYGWRYWGWVGLLIGMPAGFVLGGLMYQVALYSSYYGTCAISQDFRERMRVERERHTGNHSGPSESPSKPGKGKDMELSDDFQLTVFFISICAACLFGAWFGGLFGLFIGFQIGIRLFFLTAIITDLITRAVG